MAKAAGKSTKPLSFEKALKALESVVDSLENDDLPLDKSLSRFEEGIQLVSQCQNTLENARQKVEMLIERNGEQVLAPFEPEDD